VKLTKTKMHNSSHSSFAKENFKISVVWKV